MRRFLLVLALLASPAVAAAQGSADSVPTRVASVSGPKNVAVARVLAIVPGVGHGYAGEGGRGLAVVGGLLGIAGLTGVIMAASCVGDALSGSSDAVCEDNPIAALGGLAFYGVWGWSIYDAGAAARRTNLRASRVAQLERVPLTLSLTRRPTASGHDARALKVGLSFKVR